MASDDDLALRRARQRVEELKRSIDRLEEDIRTLTARMQTEKAEMRKVTRFINSWHELAGGAPVEGGPRPRNPDRREVASLAIAEIRKAGRPVPRRELFQSLMGGGLSLAGKDPEMVLGTMLYRDPRIVRLRGHGYWEAGVVYEPAFYWPEHEEVIGAVERNSSADCDHPS